MAPLRPQQYQSVIAAASEVRDELGLSDEQPVDVFDAIRRRGLWLVFQPMDQVLGVTLNHGSGGIMITTRRNPALQRFTAAHELGHWEMHGTEDMWDFDADITANPSAPKELEANVFASNFLLPRRLLNRRLRDKHVGHDDPVTPKVAYEISRDLGLSYTATVNRIAEVRGLSAGVRRELLKVAPLDIKRDLLGGLEPKNSRAPVWNPAPEQIKDLVVDVGDEIVTTIPENPSTGYQWIPSGQSKSVPDDSASVIVVDSTFENSNQREITAQSGVATGAPGIRRFHLKANAAGEWSQELSLRRPFEPPDKSIDVQVLSGRVKPSPEAVSSQFNATPQVGTQ
ncbi:ImmA/IrrE family metallo-endopeptidase [Brevibacterium aurantiacum]|uniref:ImmA/IrrE family metallo-endopeptidase n=1 Tax=Brevibacterium aurantiacum TaxID=273384 RepID=A0A4Z0KD18_BREAU|nr:ImmA/IrrE family metallo-endopeptidase [Brevibacterium aurantiacum]TGD36363.1 ImmA/IrrE family metallo-endopeptidase [Brevibacterium aurantiacum]